MSGALETLFLIVLVEIFALVKSSEIILSSNVSQIYQSFEMGILDLANISLTSDQTDLVSDRSLSEPPKKKKVEMDETLVPDSWDVIESVLNSTSVSTPYPPFNKTSKGGCVMFASDVEIVFGKFRDQFQNSVAKCSRKSLGSYKNTMRCLAHLSFEGKTISTHCSDCWAKTAHCGVKHCSHQCLFNTCVTKCQRCSTRSCSAVLNECAGTLWMPLPCGLDPHSPIPDNFKVQDPK